MTGRYHTADRKRHRRISLTIAASIILYVPASYLLHTNIQMNQAGLHEKYGIEYSSTPEDEDGLKKSIEECRALTAAVPVDSVFYVEMPGTVCLASEILSGDLLAALKKAGWSGSKQFQADGAIYFLEDACYDTYIKSAFSKISCTQAEIPDPVTGKTETACGTGQAILANRYINRASFSKDAPQVERAETALLSPDARKALNEGQIHPSDIKIYGGILDGADTWDSFMPDACTDELPEGIDAGKAAVIIPLSRMPAIYADIGKGTGTTFQNLHVCGLFADTEENLFERLQNNVGPRAFGELRNNRKAYQEWYDSLHDIRLAMLCICGVLFFTAIFHVFVVLVFHCMHRKHGLAILWSIGQTKQRLSLILVLESVRVFICALFVAIPISCLLCFEIYRLYRNIWDTGFVLPYRQLFLVVAVMGLVLAMAIAVSFYQMKQQDFLKEVRLRDSS